MSLYSMPCIVFAGGKSSRMGEDKAFLPFGGFDSLIQYQTQRLERIFRHVYISSKNKNKFSELKASVIEDILHSEVSAPTTGFINLFNQLKNDEYFFILSVDAPFVDEVLISKIMKVNALEYDAVIVRTPLGIHPLCGIYSRSLEEPIQKMMKEDRHKLSKLLEDSKVCYVDIQEEVLLSNLNTPDQYQKAFSLLS